MLHGRLFLIAISVLPFSFRESADAAEDATAICKSAMAAYEAATATGDPAKLAATFTAHGELVTPFGISKGREAIASANAPYMKPGDKDVDTLESARMVGRAALCSGGYVFTPSGGTNSKGFWTKVVVKEGDAWKIDVLVFNETPAK